jgi:hypothetical protein
VTTQTAAGPLSHRVRTPAARGRLISWDEEFRRGTGPGGLPVEIGLTPAAARRGAGTLSLHEDGRLIETLDLGARPTEPDLALGRLHLAGVAERRACSRLDSPGPDDLALAAAEAARALGAALATDDAGLDIEDDEADTCASFRP